MLERLFKLKEHKTNVRTEVMAGLTTFLTMAYIIIVNPLILADAGMDRGAVITTTILAAAFGTLLVGIWGNVPLAMAPGMGLNAMFAYSLVLGKQVPNWETALGVVLVSGVIFLLITLCGLREKIVNAIPISLRLSVAAGIGLFITFIGLKNMGFIITNEATLVKMSNFSFPVLLGLMGLLITCALEVRKVKGAILYGILITTATALGLEYFGVDVDPHVALPENFTDLFSLPASIAPIFMEMDLSAVFSFGLLSAAFSFMFVDLFDSIGTIMACAQNAGMVDENGKIDKVNKILEADAIATVVGACLGTSTTTTYIESGSGIAAGGRTGLTSVTVAFLFLICLLFTSIIGLVPGFATAPALIMVGIHMFRNIKQIEFQDLEVAIPAFLTIIIMPLTFSISNGIAIGFISYILICVFSGDIKKVCPTMWVIGALSILQLGITWKVVDFFTALCECAPAA